MSRYLLFFGCVLLGVLPCKSQDVIVLHKENKLTGRVLWEKSKGDSLFYRSAVSSGDSLLLFVPRRRVEYVLSDGDRRMLYRGKTRGWQPFWAALGAALLVLLPLVGGTILLTRQSLRTKLAAKPQSGVAVRMPKTENQLTLLVCTAGEQPGFVLLYLNASQNCIRLAALPAETAIPFGQGEATLAQCYAAAGPARCREALLEPLALPETTRYLALSPSVLAAIADRYGMLRVGFSGASYFIEQFRCAEGIPPHHYRSLLHRPPEQEQRRSV